MMKFNSYKENCWKEIKLLKDRKEKLLYIRISLKNKKRAFKF